ncbi:LLM class flavin-dependent oxidoreductase [Streptomyces roseicoloratus]|uniref:LLM class flavin-dependent oxidoreductase n=1 Tax=Streptomyces roseicoloratus TaxID=2508722 RepID=A0ABY9RPR6_9ACTN|nr:LLM class flavin-dependent oxidoreductase [Streptomyces roseicoloratus]WMX44186.1 LLM class flavin-dependent oxidoreductase [Streptomyces roseicoloratus]
MSETDEMPGTAGTPGTPGRTPETIGTSETIGTPQTDEGVRTGAGARLFVALPAVLDAGAPHEGLRRCTEAVLDAERAGADAVVLTGDRVPGALEPTLVLALLAGATSRVGLVADVRACDWEPYHLARELATLDVVSGGRAGVLLRHPADAAGQPVPSAHATARAEEFLRVLTGLWDSFDDDAFVHDPESGVYFRPGSLHRLDHRGPHFQVAGPLNIARPPQGHPVVVTSWAAPAGPAAPYDYRLAPDGAPGHGHGAAVLGIGAREPAGETTERARRLLTEQRPAVLVASFADGPPARPALERLTGEVLPRLRQEQLLARAADGPRGLRERLGLRRPEDRSSRARRA